MFRENFIVENLIGALALFSEVSNIDASHRHSRHLYLFAPQNSFASIDFKVDAERYFSISFIWKYFHGQELKWRY